MPDDPRLAEAKALPWDQVGGRLGIDGLKRAGRELVGPCPMCGGTDRFSVDPKRGVYNCRHCGGGDWVRLVEQHERLDFRGALLWLVGDAPPDPAEAERRRAAAARAARDRDARSDRERRKAIRLALDVWRQCLPAEGTPVRAYLARRGLDRELLPDLPDDIRFHPDLPYAVNRSGTWHRIHAGPAMVAAVRKPSGEIGAVHRTWIDAATPSGKPQIVDPETGEAQKAKKTLGSVKGGAIRLIAGQRPILVMGEGIETTLSARAATGGHAALWAGVSLSNMSGRRVTGKGMKYAGEPDLEDRDAFVPPPWVRRLIFIQDGDSEPRLTRAQLRAGLARAKSALPHLRVQIVAADEGRDLNDMLRGAA